MTDQAVTVNTAVLGLFRGHQGAYHTVIHGSIPYKHGEVRSGTGFPTGLTVLYTVGVVRHVAHRTHRTSQAVIVASGHLAKRALGVVQGVPSMLRL